MDNARKAILIGVGLFITIIVISIVLLILNLGKDITDEAGENVTNISTYLKASASKKILYTQVSPRYKGQVITREATIALFERYKDDENIVISLSKVNTLSGDEEYLSSGGFYYKKSSYGDYVYGCSMNGEQGGTEQFDGIPLWTYGNRNNIYYIYSGGTRAATTLRAYFNVRADSIKAYNLYFSGILTPDQDGTDCKDVSNVSADNWMGIAISKAYALGR